MSSIESVAEMKERNRHMDEMNEAFAKGTLSNATPEQLQNWLCVLTCHPMTGGGIDMREIIRALTINHVQMTQLITSFETTIKRLSAANDKLARKVMHLAGAAVAVGFVQILIMLIHR